MLLSYWGFLFVGWPLLDKLGYDLDCLTNPLLALMVPMVIVFMLWLVSVKGPYED
jgi:hypothetical protein